MDKISSFTVDHDKIEPGMYLSRDDGDLLTFDLRFKKPNMGEYLDDAAQHSIEHTMATILRNSEESDNVIYFGPMGCRTGYYFIGRSELGMEGSLELIKESLQKLMEWEGDVPGSKRIECGNYLNHDLLAAKRETAKYIEILENYSVSDMQY